jgi:ketose-bisphosphate aldolase
MKFCNAKAMVEKARESGYAVPAFNTNGGTYDITLAAIESAEELRSPLIIQTYEPNLAYRGFEYCAIQAGHLARGATIPIALHLDHGSSFTSVLQAVKAGYTSVMIDCSHLSIDENIKMTRQVVDAVRPVGISVEAELGHVTGGVHSCGYNSVSFTDPDEAVHFVKETGVDMLAVADGTKHGIFDRQDKINLKLVQELRRRVSVPLVQHGTCGISLELIRGLVKTGIAKMNFGEVFRMNYISYFKEYADSLNHSGHPWKIMLACKNRLKEDMKKIIRALGSEGKAG